MHSALKTILISIFVGLSFGTYLYFNYDHRPLRIIISTFSSLTIGSLMMLTIYFRHYFTVLTSYQSIKVIIITGLLIVVALLGSELTLAMLAYLSDEKYVPLSAGSVYILNILVVLVTGLPIYVSEEWKVVLNSKMLNQQYQLLQLEQQHTLFELELLRAKVNPHFLYNVHNTIAGLISKNPAKAEELVLLLSRFFRLSLNKGSITYHSVTDEMEIISTYLHMQQIRYGKRITYTITAEPATLNLQIPSFILQPIVENAVKHGIEKMPEDGSVEVNILTEELYMTITVSDSGPLFPDQPGGGLGLQLVINKLKLLYKDDFIFELHNTPEKYVKLQIPKRY